jgi:hypothetical protein
MLAPNMPSVGTGEWVAKHGLPYLFEETKDGLPYLFEETNDT